MYEEILVALFNAHMTPKLEKTEGAKSTEITAVHVDCPPIFMDEKAARIREVLKDFAVQVSEMKNSGYIKIVIVKSKKTK